MSYADGNITRLPFTQSELDAMPKYSATDQGVEGMFYRTTHGVATWCQGRADGGYTSDPNRGYWMHFCVSLRDS
jgi:hypothetical protein